MSGSARPAHVVLQLREHNNRLRPTRTTFNAAAAQTGAHLGLFFCRALILKRSFLSAFMLKLSDLLVSGGG